MINKIRYIQLIIFFSYCPLLSFSQGRTIYVDNGIRLSHKEQKMISGVNVVSLNSKGSCLMTYLADNHFAEEYYGKSDSAYVALQTLNLKKPLPDPYIIAAKKGLTIGGRCITSLPYNPMIEGSKGKYVLIFEGSLDNLPRGLISRNIKASKRYISMADSLSYLKIQYKGKIYDSNINSYTMILKEEGLEISTPGCFVVDINPRKDSFGIWHLAIGCAPDNYILVIKSKDLYNWEYEMVLPIKGNETDLYYTENDYYYVTRASSKIFFGGKKVPPYIIENSVASRPRIFVNKDDIYVMYNNIDKEYMAERSMSSLCKLIVANKSLQEVMKMQRKETIQYYDIIKFKENFYELFSTDPTDKFRYSKGELQMIVIPQNGD